MSGTTLEAKVGSVVGVTRDVSRNASTTHWGSSEDDQRDCALDLGGGFRKGGSANRVEGFWIFGLPTFKEFFRVLLVRVCDWLVWYLGGVERN